MIRRIARRFTLLLLVATAPASADLSPSPAWQGFVRAAQTVRAYTEIVDTYDRCGGSVEHRRLKMYFHEPFLVRADVLEGADTGMSVLWRGGPTVTARRLGMLSIFRLTLSREAPRVSDCLGDTIDTPFWPTLIARLQPLQLSSVVPGESAVGPTIALRAVCTDNVSVVVYLSTASYVPVENRAVAWEETGRRRDVF